MSTTYIHRVTKVTLTRTSFNIGYPDEFHAVEFTVHTDKGNDVIKLISDKPLDLLDVDDI